MSFNLRLEMNNEKREALKNSLNQLIGIKNKSSLLTKSKANNKLNLNMEKIDKNIKEETVKEKPKNPLTYNIGTPVLSADRLLQQNSFRIEMKNFFEVPPFLHFFEVTNSTLHLVFLDGIRPNEPVKWEVMPLDITFKIPSFHRTIATEKGDIYLIGGTSPETLKRSKDIYQYNKTAKTLTKVAELLVARSSHSVLCH